MLGPTVSSRRLASSAESPVVELAELAKQSSSLQEHAATSLEVSIVALDVLFFFRFDKNGEIDIAPKKWTVS